MRQRQRQDPSEGRRGELEAVERYLDTVRALDWVRSRSFTRRAALGDREEVDAQYAAAFRKCLGFDLLEGDREAAVSAIQSFPIKKRLLAALDDWGLSALKLKNGKGQLLLAIAREVEPEDTWHNEVRSQ